MAFVVGSVVAVISVHQHGKVLEVLPGGRYRVAVGGMTLVCHEDQLETVSHSKKRQRHERETPAPVAQERATVPPPVDTSRFQSIDLHGMTVPEALAALPVFLDRAIRAGLGRVEIIHGISGGKLRGEVRKYLAGVPSVTCAVADERNPGVTVVYF
jgi:dsDNA-specific endonuclease/ATPase MutS2